MEKAVDELVRQQYLVPRRSVSKLRRLSKKERVSATEIVRRAIDAYEPSADDATAAQESAALDLLAEIHGTLRKTLRRIDSDLASLRTRQQALEDGSVRAKARREAERWIRSNPDALPGLTELFGG